MNRIRTALRRDDGASAVEYGLIVAMIAAVLVAVVFTLGVLTKGKFTETCSNWNAADGTASSC
jgi:pilus assembly protein Flp/PilA